MATSRCLKCENTSFEMITVNNVKHSEYEITFIQCAVCGSVVGISEIHNIAYLLKKIENIK